MKNRFDLLFLGAMVAFAENTSAEEAVEQLFRTLDERVKYQEYNKILVKLFKNFDINPGKYDEQSYTFENEDILKKELVDQLRMAQEERGWK